MEDRGLKIDYLSSTFTYIPTRPMKKKLRVALLFGGKSAEHEISLISARNIVEAMDKKKYDIVAIGIDKQGRSHLDQGARLLRGQEQSKVEFRGKTNIAAVLPGENATPMVRGTGSRLGALEVGLCGP